MRYRRKILCLWPGLPELWLQGRVSALAMAVAFSGLLQGMMLTSFVWPELAPPGVRTAGWFTLLCVWLFALGVSLRRMPYLAGERYHECTDALFREAQTEYLKGNWYQAQSLLEQVLGQNAGDVDAGLMLASLYRRVRQIGEAKEQLRRLGQFELSEKWRLEIQREFGQLDQLESNSDATEEEPASTVLESHAA